MAKIRTELTKKFRILRKMRLFGFDDVLQQQVEEWDTEGHFSIKWVDVPIVTEEICNDE